MTRFTLKNYLPLLITAAFITLSVVSYAQIGPPPTTGSTGGTGGTGPSGAPIDGGIGILLASGLVYGAKKLYGKNTTEESTEKQ
jgi:hypothetical protein